MLQEILLICSLLVLGTSCVQGDRSPDPKGHWLGREGDGISLSSKGLQKIVVVAPFDKVWRAVQIVMIDYPPLLNSSEEGIFETDFVQGQDIWIPPHLQGSSTAGHRYKLFVYVTKGSLQGRPSIKVSVRKQEEVLVDFFSSPQPVTSDGLEEQVILYRIKRELQIDGALRKMKSQENEEALL